MKKLVTALSLIAVCHFQIPFFASMCMTSEDMSCCKDMSMTSMSCCQTTPVKVGDPMQDVPAIQSAKTVLFCSVVRQDIFSSQTIDSDSRIHGLEMNNRDSNLYSNKVYLSLQTYLI